MVKKAFFLHFFFFSPFCHRKKHLTTSLNFSKSFHDGRTTTLCGLHYVGSEFLTFHYCSFFSVGRLKWILQNLKKMWQNGLYMINQEYIMTISWQIISYNNTESLNAPQISCKWKSCWDWIILSKKNAFPVNFQRCVTPGHYFS